MSYLPNLHFSRLMSTVCFLLDHLLYSSVIHFNSLQYMFANRVHCSAWFRRVFDTSCTHRSPYLYRIFGTCQVILLPSIVECLLVIMLTLLLNFIECCVTFDFLL